MRSLCFGAYTYDGGGRLSKSATFAWLLPARSDTLHHLDGALCVSPSNPGGLPAVRRIPRRLSTSAVEERLLLLVSSPASPVNRSARPSAARLFLSSLTPQPPTATMSNVSGEGGQEGGKAEDVRRAKEPKQTEGREISQPQMRFSFSRLFCVFPFSAFPLSPGECLSPLCVSIALVLRRDSPVRLPLSEQRRERKKKKGKKRSFVSKSAVVFRAERLCCPRRRALCMCVCVCVCMCVS